MIENPLQSAERRQVVTLKLGGIQVTENVVPAVGGNKGVHLQKATSFRHDFISCFWGPEALLQWVYAVGIVISELFLSFIQVWSKNGDSDAVGW